MTSTSRWLVRVGSLLLFAGVWEAAARWVDGLLFPTFLETAAVTPHVLATAEVWNAVWISHQALLIGFGAAVVIGVAAGLLMGRLPAADVFVDPYLTILLTTPITALIPVVILAFGLGLSARALMVTLFAVTSIAISTRAGLRTLDPAWFELARSFGASERQLWGAVVLPGALPGIVTGLKLGLARAFAGMVAVELLLVAVGVGRLVIEYQGNLDGAAVYALVILLVAEAMLLLQGLQWVEGRLAPWASQLIAE